MYTIQSIFMCGKFPKQNIFTTRHQHAFKCPYRRAMVILHLQLHLIWWIPDPIY